MFGQPTESKPGKAHEAVEIVAAALRLIVAQARADVVRLRPRVMRMFSGGH